MRKEFINKVKKEIKTDKRTYLENCKKFRADYMEVARILFPEYYKNFRDDYNLYMKKAIEYKNNQQYKEEKEILEKAVGDNTDIPGAYERLARIFIKENNLKTALDVCNKWFNSTYWKIPNMATTSLRILDLKEKIESELN